MSSTLSFLAPRNGSLFTASYEKMDRSDAQRRMSAVVLLASCVAIAAATFTGGVYSLWVFFRMRWKTSPWLIVASMSVDDIISVIPLSLFMLLQWERDGDVDGEGDGGSAATICTLSGLLYVFQGLSSNMKACLIAAYTFYVTKRDGIPRPVMVMGAIAGVWVFSLAVSALPLCGWGRFTPAPLGCFPESHGFYALLLVSSYSLCFCGLLLFFVPLTYPLLCSGELQKRFHPSYLSVAADQRGDGSAPLCDLPCSRDSLDRSFGAFNELSSDGLGLGARCMLDTCPSPASECGPRDGAIRNPVVFAQKRFSMILAVVRVVLWMPMMIIVLVQRTVKVRSTSLEVVEIVSFFLTLLAPVVTPMFVLSERWIHLPCGCFINCRQDTTSQESNEKKRRFEFNLSFQQGYEIYKISHTTKADPSPSVEKPSYHNLFNCDFVDVPVASLQAESDIKSPHAVDTSTLRDHGELHLEGVAGAGEALALADCLQFPHVNHGDQGGFFSGIRPQDPGDLNLNDTLTVFEGAERRLSRVECRKIELSDWEWCRSKSERTQRQRSGGGLAIPLCAFQGTVSLHAPTGKTLSLSTYEVSSDGLKISPNAAKKVEVYRSKSVGHEPNADDPSSEDPPGGVSIGGVGMEVEMGMGEVGMGDTNVKIHLEVLEICDNEEAMDSVSIISNISQSSAHARSPSLRYSRRENRFVSCDLGETASYSLLIPNSGNPEADNLNISIPDTVEAHRQNSRRQTQEMGGYHEEIQLLNEAYRRHGEDRED
ncbi:hypothetical protein DPEC_G00244190 [Dallia pectoralis]|uniref:Uncharacterized protein n=1 Tax=Dallia pectoralis TaxID=75939 RepID=A0ACC2FVS9_DALPE|nr:hypothetical protein DPEC_G00244190 [Dallia pectoralis]